MFPLPMKPIVRSLESTSGRVVSAIVSANPVARGPGSWHWLIERVVQGRDQLGAVEVLLGRVVPEPIFLRFVTLDDRVPCVGRMVTCMLGWGRVTAADVSTTRATTQVEPPTMAGEALDTSRTTGRYRRINVHSVPRSN